jgi:single-strand DNA-binding protein
MPSANKVIIMGHLTRDPELRVTPKGTPVASFCVAINRSIKLESGEQRDEVTYVDVDAWGKQGETIAKFFSKGKPIYVEGRLRLEQWEDKNTKEKRSRMKVVLEQFQFLDGKAQDSAGGSQAQHEPAPAANQRQPAPAPQRNAAPAPRPAPADSFDEDVPF